MFGSSKPLATLSSGLLARKGQAKPAMRPQAFATLASVTPLDDLGWNDMGSEPAPPAPVELPPVLVERAVLKEEVEHAPAEAPEVVAERVEAIVAETLPRPRASGRMKAAFTLRLESGRHLRLRLASAVKGRSSQALLVDALDAYLNTLPEVEELARRCSTPFREGDPK